VTQQLQQLRGIFTLLWPTTLLRTMPAKRKANGVQASHVAKKTATKALGVQAGPVAKKTANHTASVNKANIDVMFAAFSHWIWKSNAHKQSGVLVVLLIALEVMGDVAFQSYFQRLAIMSDVLMTKKMLQKAWWTGYTKQMLFERFDILLNFAQILFSDTKTIKVVFISSW